jgi:quercetin dioxygenase-like cupin family protein
MRLLHGKGPLAAAILIAVVAVWSIGAGTTTPHAPVRLLPEQLQWSGNAKQHGLQTAALFGNPRAAEPYAERIKIPAHTRLKPHRHPNAIRMVTVLSGTLYFAFGEQFDEAKLEPMPVGTFFTEPKNAAHYAMTADEEVVLQLDAVGPAGTEYVKPKELE